MSKHFTRRAVGMAAIVWLWLIPMSAAAEAPWLRVKAAEFTLITQLKEKEALNWAGEFSQFVAALGAFLPVDKTRLPRLTIVLFARERDFNAHRPLGADGKPQEMAGFFSRRDAWAVAALPATSQGDRARATIYHEGTHWFMSGYTYPNPVWLEEGVAEVFSTFQMDKKEVSWGRAIEGHVRALNVLEPLPLEKLIYLAKADLFTGGDEGMERTGIAYAESWAFVHYLIFSQRNAKALTQYVRGLRSGAHPDEVFQQAFGHNYRELDGLLREYLRNGQYYTAKFPLAPLPELRVEPATPIQIESALARLCVAGRRYPEADEHAQKVMSAAGDGPEGYELLGELQMEKSSRAQAREAFEKAVERGSRDFRPYYEIAAADHAAGTRADGSAGNLSPEDARRIVNGYERAINFNPRYRPAFQGVAGLIGLVPKGNEEDVKFLEMGLQIFPDDAMIILGLAVSADRTGDNATARKLLTAVLKAEPPPPSYVMSYARRLDASWKQRDLASQVNELTKEKKFDEALALARAALAESGDPATRGRVQTMVRSLEYAQRNEQVRVASAAGDWTEVRRIIQEILDSDAAPLLKTQMSNRLKDLDRRGLGKAK